MSLKMGLSRFADTLLIRKGLLLRNGHRRLAQELLTCSKPTRPPLEANRQQGDACAVSRLISIKLARLG